MLEVVGLSAEEDVAAVGRNITTGSEVEVEEELVPLDPGDKVVEVDAVVPERPAKGSTFSEGCMVR